MGKNIKTILSTIKKVLISKVVIDDVLSFNEIKDDVLLLSATTKQDLYEADRIIRGL